MSVPDMVTVPPTSFWSVRPFKRYVPLSTFSTPPDTTSVLPMSLMIEFWSFTVPAIAKMP